MIWWGGEVWNARRFYKVLYNMRCSTALDDTTMKTHLWFLHEYAWKVKRRDDKIKMVWYLFKFKKFFGKICFCLQFENLKISKNERGIVHPLVDTVVSTYSYLALRLSLSVKLYEEWRPKKNEKIEWSYSKKICLS